MVSKALFSTFVSVLLLETVYGNCYNSLLPQAPVSLVSGGCGVGTGLSGLNLASNVYSSVSPACSSNYEILSGPLTVSSGSSITPNGLKVYAENLEILGQLGVVGSLPFSSAVVVEGGLLSDGQASVVYSSAPGVGLTSAGCGQGLSGISGNVLPGAALNNGLVGYGNNNLLGSNLINSGYSSIGGCGCN